MNHRTGTALPIALLLAVLLTVNTVVPAMAGSPAAAAAAASSDYARYDGLTVRHITFVGLKRTKPKLLKNYMETKSAKPFDSSVFHEDMRRIRNLELFDRIAVAIRRIGNKIDITIHLRDKWSLLPYANFVRGGGSYELVAGVYDVNVAGCLFTLDAMFVLFDGKPSGILYFKMDRLGGLPIALYADGGYSRSLRTTYAERTTPSQTLVIDSGWGNLMIRWEPFAWARVGLWQKALWRNYEFARASNNRFYLPHDGLLSESGLVLSLGKTSYRNYMMQGLIVNVWLSTSTRLLGAQVTYQKVSWDARGYWILGPRAGNLAAWLEGGFMQGGTLADQFALGSFSGLRGFKYAQFVGRSFVAGTIEYRTGLVPTAFPVVAKLLHVFRGKTLRWQGALFANLGTVAGSPHFATNESGRLLSAIGAGLRVIFVPFFKAVLRIDVAYTLSPFRTFDLMIATQQAF